MSFATRLHTFDDQWPNHQTTARQLAALGHVCDRPPLESLEEGSRCVDCGLFLPKQSSVDALEAPITSSTPLSFHNPKCTRLQIRMPLESSRETLDYSSLVNRWEKRSRAIPPGSRRSQEELHQTSGLFSLPTELRLHIYGYILPSLSDTEHVIEIVPLHRDSTRVITKAGFDRPGPRDKTKANLLLACKTIYLEALDLLYANTTFKVATTRTLYLFLRNIGKVGRQMLRAVDFTCGQREDAVALALLGSCGELRNVTIRLARPKLLFGLMAPLWIADGVSCLLALSGLEDVKFAPCSTKSAMDMNDGKPDAALLRRELMRPKGAPSGVREVEGVLDL